MTPEVIIRRYQAQNAQRQLVEQTWDLVEKFIGPIRGGKFFQDNVGELSVDWRRGRDVFDNTAIVAADILASAVHSALTSPALQWFGLRFRNDEMNENAEAKVWLEACAEEIYQALGDSNFNTEINETYLDLVTYGSSILVEEEEDKVYVNPRGGDLVFSSVPIRECFFEAGADGRPVVLYRCYEWTPVQIVDKFGNRTPEDIKQKAMNGATADVREKVIFCVWRRKEVNENSVRLMAPKLRPYGCIYVLERGCVPLSDEGGYYEMPAFFIRWKKSSGSQWGHGPGTLALSDVMTLNQLVELVLKAAGKVVDPATLVNERNLLSDLDLDASGVTVARDIAGIKPYESAARFDVSSMQVDDLRRKINRTFLVDQLELKESPAMTATEVQVRYELMQRLLGPTLGRLQSDLLDPLIERTFRILWRAGKLPPMPEKLAMLRPQLDVEYTGPLARAQRVDRVASMERWAAQIGQLSQIFPEMHDLVNPDRLGRESARLLGVPTKSLNSQDEVKTLRRNREQQNNKVAMLTDANAAATAMQGVAAAAKDLKAAEGA